VVLRLTLLCVCVCVSVCVCVCVYDEYMVIAGFTMAVCRGKMKSNLSTFIFVLVQACKLDLLIDNETAASLLLVIWF
jgi:hypothetical protein